MTSALVRFDHGASSIVNANHSIVWPAAKLCVVNCVADCVWLALPGVDSGIDIRNQFVVEMYYDYSA